MPQGVRNAFAPAPPDLVLRIGDQGGATISWPGGASEDIEASTLDSADLAQSLAKAGPARRVRIELADGQVLHHRMSVPRAARSRIDRIVALDLDRLTPLAAADLVFATSVDSANIAGSLEVDVVIAERALITSLSTAVAKAGLDLEGIRPASTMAIDLNPTAKGADRHARRITGGIAAAAMALMLVALLVTHLRIEADIASTEAEVARLRREARVVEKLRLEVDGARRRAAAMQEARTRPSAAALIGEIAARLPDDTHLFQLSLLRGELRVNGVSGDAARLPPLLEQSLYFPAARLAAPIVRDTERRLDRFEIAAELPKLAAP